MIRGTAIALVVLTSFSLGHAPCCLVPSPCWDHPAEVLVDSCCPNCAPEPVEATECTSPELVGTLELEAGFAPALLPAIAVRAETAPAPRSVLAEAPAPLEPPRAGPTLPLLL